MRIYCREIKAYFSRWDVCWTRNGLRHRNSGAAVFQYNRDWTILHHIVFYKDGIAANQSAYKCKREDGL